MIYDYPVNMPLPLKKLLIKRSLYKASRKCERLMLRNSVRILEDKTPRNERRLRNFAHELKEETNSELKGKGVEISDLVLKCDAGFIEFNINFDKKESVFYCMPLSTDKSTGPYKIRLSLISLFTGENLYDMVERGFKQTNDYINTCLE